MPLSVCWESQKQPQLTGNQWSTGDAGSGFPASRRGKGWGHMSENARVLGSPDSMAVVATPRLPLGPRVSQALSSISSDSGRFPQRLKNRKLASLRIVNQGWVETPFWLRVHLVRLHLAEDAESWGRSSAAEQPTRLRGGPGHRPPVRTPALAGPGPLQREPTRRRFTPHYLADRGHALFLFPGDSRDMPAFFFSPKSLHVLSSHFVPCRPLSSGLSFALSVALPPGGHLSFSLLHPHSSTAPSTALSLASGRHGTSLAG